MSNANKDTGVHLMGGVKSAAEVAAEGMKRHSEYRAEMEAYRKAKEAQKEMEKNIPAPQRRLSHRDIYG